MLGLTGSHWDYTDYTGTDWGCAGLTGTALGMHWGRIGTTPG